MTLEHVHYVAISYAFAAIVMVLLVTLSRRAALRTQQALDATQGDSE